MSTQRNTIALQAVADASAFLRTQFRVIETGTEKADGTFVSDADRSSDAIIVEALQKAFPNDGILSEEGKEIAGTTGYRWILDPLDGTHNFLAGIPLFGIILALEKDRETVFAVCAFPMLEETFVAEKGKGASCNGKRIIVSPAASLKGRMVLIDGSTEVVSGAIGTYAPHLRKNDCRFRFLGNCSFSLTRVALGSSPAAIICTGKIWDLAAPALLVQEAGGTVTDSSGKPWAAASSGHMLATNGAVHTQALSALSH